MIHLFAVCKNDRFVRAIALLLGQKGVKLIDTCTQPGLAKSKLLACEPRPDVVLLDANWNNHPFSGPELLAELLNAHQPTPKIILMTHSFEERTVKRLQGMGASGYFSRASTHPDDIFQCIKNVHEGATFFRAL